MKIIKFFRVRLYQIKEISPFSSLVDNGSGGCVGGGRGGGAFSKMLYEGYSKSEVVLPPRDETITLLTDPHGAESKTFRADIVDSIVCTPVYECEDEAKSDSDAVKVKVHDHACVNCFADKGPCLGDCHVTEVNKARKSSFEDVVKPVIKWLNENANPHASIIVDCTSAELLTGEIGVHTEEFLKG